MTKSKPVKVPMNLIQAEVYAYTSPFVGQRKSAKGGKKYYELQVVQTEDGVTERLVEVDYPITPEYVKSFEASANYKNDLNSASNAKASSPNLGDVTKIQELMAMDSAQVQALKEKIALAEQLKQVQATEKGQPLKEEKKEKDGEK